MFDIPGRTNGLSFSFFTGNWSFSFVQIFSLTDERFWTLEDIKVDGTEPTGEWLETLENIKGMDRQINFQPI
ncbi:unnamed protein product [Rhizophagus irregularis]|nr:unnamed protein product [Rhizophagus irregularis]